MPRYDVQCQDCGRITEVTMTFEQHDQAQDGFYWECECPSNGWTTVVDNTLTMLGHEFRFVIKDVPAVQYRGSGFVTTDSRSKREKYNFEHFDGSGTNSEMKSMDNRVRDPDSTVPKFQPSGKHFVKGL